MIQQEQYIHNLTLSAIAELIIDIPNNDIIKIVDIYELAYLKICQNLKSFK